MVLDTEALEQPAVKPVAWLDVEMQQAYTTDELADATGTGFLPLYAAPQAQQPAEVPFLTDKEILEMADDGVFLGNVKEIARAVEAAVRKKAGLK